MIKKRMYRTTIHAGSTLREYPRWLAPSRERHFTKNAVFSEAG